jgi:hypothetical protein
LLIDFYALKSDQFAWYIEYHDEMRDLKGLGHLPNAAYSLALAHWEIESKEGRDHTKSTEFLKEAIRRFPTVISLLIAKMQVSDPALDDSFFKTPVWDSSMTKETLLLLIDMYVEASHPTWKVPELLDWLKSTSKSLKPTSASPLPPLSTPSPFLKSSDDSLSLNLQRMVVLSDETTFISRLPSGALDDIYLFDPFPPMNPNRSVYDEIRGIRHGDEERGGSMMAPIRGLMNYLFGGAMGGEEEEGVQDGEEEEENLEN